MRVALRLGRNSLRRRATSWVVATLIVAIAGAVALGCLAAARRTASAHERYLQATNTADVNFASDPQCHERPCTAEDFTAIGGVTAVSRRVRVIGALEQADGSIDPSSDGDAFFGLADDTSWDVDRPLVVSGRLPNLD